uniref:FIIND domain-containing protein n=1 Tax=Gasterosteus aculeatus TaxID=69293 RepID=G3PG02_GASAC
MAFSKERAQRMTTRASAGWPGPLLHGQVTTKVKSPLRLPTLREPRKGTAEDQSSGREKRTQRDSATSYDFSYESYPSSSVSPLSPVTSVEVRAPFQDPSSPNMFVKSSFELTPDITTDKHNETFRLRCYDAFESSPTEHEREPGGDADVLTETAASFAAASHSVTGASPAAGQQEFTPDITTDEDDETFRLRCSGPGLYLCSVTGLVFHMGGE